MGIRGILKKKGDADGDEDGPQSPTGGFFTSPPLNQSQNQYQQLPQQQYQHQPQYQEHQQYQQHEQHQQHQKQRSYQQTGTAPPRPPPPAPLQTPEFTFIRSDTFTTEVIHPPSGPAGGLQTYEEDSNHLQTGDGLASPTTSTHSNRRSFDVFRRSNRSSRSASVSSHISVREREQDQDQDTYGEKEKDKDKGKDKDVNKISRKLSHRLHLHRSPSTSTHVPVNLPEIVVPEGLGGNKPATTLTVPGDGSDDSASNSSSGKPSPQSRAAQKPPPADPAVESQWEKRATLLALENEKQQIHGVVNPPTTPEKSGRRGRAASNAGNISPAAVATASAAASARNRSASAVSSKELDASIQEAIRLHEEGKLEDSTRLFGILADPHGYNNPLSQVLYGLALRHGWGCEPDTEAAVTYLSAAASNAAAVEELALQAGLKKGGAAKGELVLAIFELANCFRHGWGLEKDPIAAKQYYETAANLGDTDAMNEVAWCYLEGFGCKKDKFASSKYYRLAEQNGNKTLGNTWIWKEKYDPEKQKPKKK
ncbi:cell cycle inhibitor nif1 [Ophiostoma piceae UAMH 11346]|uniref:Cell cycle inhibitor nif1 n=1 Tax=Ophiostoma piceae (strain UAMH 11346) TaxID=1262450 RepID=S3C1W6_OPHP1|nr:cell cycle inhibitor nif1 [Ophiostoma piceae UAMH 11346]